MSIPENDVRTRRASHGSHVSPAPESDMSLLAIDGLSVMYGPIRAVHNVSLTVNSGDIVALLGANGAGKSSTLKAIVGLAPATAGTLRVGAHDIRNKKPEEIVRLGTTLTPEGRLVFEKLTVSENLHVGASATRMSRSEVATRQQELYETFPILGKRESQLAGTLSGGEQQQLAIARSLMANPTLLLLDEPSLGLAPKIQDEIFDMLLTLRREGLTILLVEQNVELALEVANHAHVLAGGALVKSGEASDLRRDTDLAESYLGTGEFESVKEVDQ